MHCQKCLIGKTSPKITRAKLRSGVVYHMDEVRNYSYLYLCGMPNDYPTNGALKNFHLALAPKAAGAVSRRTYNGYTVTVTGAEALPIPDLPDDFEGLPRKHTRCKNFQFGVEYF